MQDSLEFHSQASSAKISSDKSVVDLDAFAAVASSVNPINEPRVGLFPTGGDTPIVNTSSRKDSKVSEEDDISIKRRIHNICERKRRLSIRKGFASLQERLPSGASIRLSKMEIIQAAVNHIKALRGGLEDVKTEVLLLRQLKARKVEMHGKTHYT